MNIRLQQASLSFGSTGALRQCDLTVRSGEQIALIGPSGSGKSSLLRVLATEYPLDSGSYAVDGELPLAASSRHLKAVRSTIAYIPQHLALVPNLKVHQNILLGGVGSTSTLKTVLNLLSPHRTSITRIHQILTNLGIPEKLYHRTDSLSGGQQQRVAIARAIFQKASLILADEPVSAIDPHRAHSLLERMTSLATENGASLIASLHNLTYAKKFFPRLVGMRDGEIVFDGPPSEFSETKFNQLYQLGDV